MSLHTYFCVLNFLWFGKLKVLLVAKKHILQKKHKSPNEQIIKFSTFLFSNLISTPETLHFRPHWHGGGSVDGVTCLLRDLPISASEYAFGRTKIFIRTSRTVSGHPVYYVPKPWLFEKPCKFHCFESFTLRASTQTRTLLASYLTVSTASCFVKAVITQYNFYVRKIC